MGQNMSANRMKLFVSFSINYSTLSFEEAIERGASAARELTQHPSKTTTNSPLNRVRCKRLFGGTVN